MNNQLLLINDVNHFADRTAAILEGLGWEVYIAAKEKHVLDFCAAQRPMLVIADVEMSAGQGFESIQTVRRLFSDMFILAVTRGGHKEIWEKVAEACGANRYIVGPVSASQFSESLDPAVEARLVHT
jgi:CheY-like chemotaxis protein